MADRPESGLGSGGSCICVACGKRLPHRPGIPCREERCPDCGKAMLREGSPHHEEVAATKGGSSK